MTVRVAPSGAVELIGTCPSEDAETLLQQLIGVPGATVDWRGCRSAHTAVIQVLMAAKPKLVGSPANVHLKEWAEPVLTRAPG